MEKEPYTYFKRDVSWLSFNYRVLLEAEDRTSPVYERLHFLSIYASNLEEFYEIRVAEHRGAIMRGNYAAESVDAIEATLEEITAEVNRQQQAFYRLFHEDVLPELRRQGIYLYQEACPKPFHEEFVRSYFDEEVFPFLSPVTIETGIRTFIRDRRLYLVVCMKKRTTGEPHYVLIKVPYAKVPRFVPLPTHGGVYYYMFIDDVIRVNLPLIFPGYKITGCHSIKISRDADIYLEEENPENMIQTIRRKVEKRKIGALCRFMYDSAMPADFLATVCKVFHIEKEDLVLGGRYMNLQDLSKFPNPKGNLLTQTVPPPMRVLCPDRTASVFRAVEKRDVLLHFPYQSFDCLIDFLTEAAFDPEVDEIKITQYRVAEHSAVINTLIRAAENGKRVTVFVELKARFDEENNMSTAEQMKQAGIKIIYSIPGLKVHAKVAVILRRAGQPGFAYLSTGNFNEKTAKIYSDMALLTCDKAIIAEVRQVFSVLEGEPVEPDFHLLLVAHFNMVPELVRMIRREIDHVKAGRRGYILLKMNGLHDERMIDELYRASESGVEIDLIVRGICCLVPDQPYSRHIRITRIVDMYLEHARVWYFYNDGAEDVYLSSADWMNRNLNRRIETAFPVLVQDIKQEILDILQIQLRDNVKACFIDEQLHNVFKRDLATGQSPVRAQEAIYEYIRKRNQSVISG
ncbi:MAG: polyphosphate kinase 1 [Tannerella sp.]|jgi:polyphosphate kinase|nr:polyphosphate kinase 1 [Tannerella sp.]